MALNISDIGAMGGMPRFAMVSLGLRGESPVPDVVDMYRGFLDELNPLEASVVGGNLTKSGDSAFIDITLLGEVEPAVRVNRNGARPGDAVLVTGHPGEAAAGLAMLLQGNCPEDPMGHPLVRAYLRPSHRAGEGRAIAKTGYATAMIDTSDGFLGDLGHICEASHVGAELWETGFPFSGELRQVAPALKQDPRELFLGESDDYELIITCSPDRVDHIREAVASVGAVLVAEVGRLTREEKEVILIRKDASREKLTPSGWDHFKN
jgi:thiamine-monophosphate kinase